MKSPLLKRLCRRRKLKEDLTELHTNIITVSLLEDNGSNKNPVYGSFRYALNHLISGQLNKIRFSAAGYIELLKPVEINVDNVEIDGRGQIDIIGWGIKVKASNITIKNLRIKPGNKIAPEEDRHRVDCLTVGDSNIRLTKVTICNCSLYWSCDELFSTFNVNKLVLKDCILAEALYNAGHKEGAHSKAILMGPNTGCKVTIIRCLIAHNAERNPRFPADGKVNFINNLVFNWEGSYAGYTSDTSTNGKLKANIVSNIIISGQNSNIKSDKACWLRLYTAGNYYFTNNIYYTHDNSQVAFTPYLTYTDNINIQNQPAFKLPPKIVFATELEQHLYDNVGAKNGQGLRDDNDERLIDLVRERRGEIIDTPPYSGLWIAF